MHVLPIVAYMLRSNDPGGTSQALECSRPSGVMVSFVEAKYKPQEVMSSIRTKGILPPQYLVSLRLGVPPAFMRSATSPNLTTRQSSGRGPSSVIWKPSGTSSVFTTERTEATESTSVFSVFSVVKVPFLFTAPPGFAVPHSARGQPRRAPLLLRANAPPLPRAAALLPCRSCSRSGWGKGCSRCGRPRRR